MAVYADASIYQFLNPRDVTPLDPFGAMQQGQRSAFGQLALAEARRQQQVEEQTRARLRQAYAQSGTPVAPGMSAVPAVSQIGQGIAPGGPAAPPELGMAPGAEATAPGAGPQPQPGVAAPTGVAPGRGVYSQELMRDLGMIDPDSAMKVEKTWRDSQTAQLEMHGKQAAIVSNVARAILLHDTQEAYVAGVQELRRYGIPVDHLPAFYDRRLVEGYYAMGQDAESRVKEAQARLIGTQAALAPRKLDLEETQETRLEKQRLVDEDRFELDTKRFGLAVAEDKRKEREEQRKTQEFAGGLYPYSTDPKHNIAINRHMQAAGLPRGSTPPPDLLARAEQDVLSGAVEVSAAQGAEKARLELEQKPLDAATEKAVSELGVLQDMTDDVTDLFEPGYAGQFEGRWGAVRQWTGSAGQREVIFRRVVADMKDQLLRARSGAAITQSEYERLSTLVPNVTDADTTFQAKLLGFRRALDQTKQRKLETATTARGQLRRQQPEMTPLPERTPSEGAGIGEVLSEQDIADTIAASHQTGRTPKTRQQIIDDARKAGMQVPER